jgi:hypothetical protein
MRFARISLVLTAALAVPFAACVGDSPGTSSGNPVQDASVADTTVLPDAASERDAAADAASDDPMCASVVSYWPGEQSGVDQATPATNLNWDPGSGARYKLAKFGTAFAFPSSGNATLIADSYARLASSTAMTISLWFTTTTASKNFFTLANNTLPQLSVGTNNSTFQAVVGTEVTRFAAGANITPGAFTHVAFVLNTVASTSSWTLYVNGGKLGATENLSALVTSTTFPAKSRLTVGSFNFDGTIDELTVFNRALTAAELGALASTGLPCQGSLARPVLDKDSLRCSPPTAIPELRCPSAKCSSPSSVCCPSGFAPTPICSLPTSCSVANTFSCTSSASCMSGQHCCATGFAGAPISDVECSSVGNSPSVSTCKSSCGAGELELCNAGVTCETGKKCTGFTARNPGQAVDYPLGACIP